MNISDFEIGLEFYTATSKWRCTDIGTRTIVAVRLGEHKMISTNTQTGKVTEYMSDDSALTAGIGPFCVSEDVFDIYDMDASRTVPF